MNHLLKRMLFISKEGYRTLTVNSNKTLMYFFLSYLNLFLIGGNLIVIINLNYLLEVFSTRSLSRPLVLSLVPVIDRMEDLKYVHYIMLGLFILLFIYLSKHYINIYINNYINEINLILKLGADKKLGKLPIIFGTLSIQFMASLLSWATIGLFFTFIKERLVSEHISLSILSFQDFRYTLIIFYMLLTFWVILGVVNVFYYSSFK